MLIALKFITYIIQLVFVVVMDLKNADFLTVWAIVQAKPSLAGCFAAKVLKMQERD